MYFTYNDTNLIYNVILNKINKFFNELLILNIIREPNTLVTSPVRNNENITGSLTLHLQPNNKGIERHVTTRVIKLTSMSHIYKHNERKYICIALLFI